MIPAGCCPSVCRAFSTRCECFTNTICHFMPSRAAGVSASGGPLPRRGLFRYLVDFALAEYRNLHQNHVAGVIHPFHSERIPEHKPTYRGGHNRSNQIPHKSAFFHGSIFNLFDMFVIRAGADSAGFPCGFIVRTGSTKGSPFRLFRIAARSILLILSRLFFIGLSVLKVCAHICVTFGGHNQFASINERARLNIYQWFISHFAAAFPLGKLLRRKNLLGYVRAFCQRVAVLTVFCPRSFAL